MSVNRSAVVTAGLCAVASALFLAVEVTDAPEPVQMPVTPHLLTAAAAAAAALLVLARPLLRLPVRTGIAAACAAVLGAGSLAAVPHTLMTLIVWAGGLVTRGEGPFDVTPAWLLSATYLVAVAAAASLVGWTVADRRHAGGRCSACGRATAGPDAPVAARLPLWAAVAVVGAVPYGALKLCWALGIGIGLTGHAFAAVTLSSPGFGDTVVLTGIGVATAVAMGLRRRGRWLRPLLLGVGGLGSLMLLPVAAVALVQVVEVALGFRTIDDTEIAPWAFLVVYASFAVWGTGLAGLTVGYARSTRPPCPRHP